MEQLLHDFDWKQAPLFAFVAICLGCLAWEFIKLVYHIIKGDK